MQTRPRKRVNVSLLLPFLVIALVFGVMLWNKYRASHEMPVAPQLNHPAGKKSAILFFVADGVRLEREARELDPCEDVTACLKDLLEELLNGPVGELDEPLPEGTVINKVVISGDQAVIDLNRAFVEAMPSGSSAEMLAVYSLVNTVTANFPQIARVKLNIEGEEQTVLRHLDLSDPLLPDYALEQPPSLKPSGNTAVTPSKSKETK